MKIERMLQRTSAKEIAQRFGQFGRKTDQASMSALDKKMIL